MKIFENCIFSVSKVADVEFGIAPLNIVTYESYIIVNIKKSHLKIVNWNKSVRIHYGLNNFLLYTENVISYLVF